MIDRIDQLPGDLMCLLWSAKQDLVAAQVGHDVRGGSQVGEHLGEHFFDVGGRLVPKRIKLILSGRVGLGFRRQAACQRYQDRGPDVPTKRK